MKTIKTLGLAASLGLSALSVTAPAQAGDTSHMGDIILVAFNYCPRDYLSADGQLLNISDYAALFSLYGTNFGGNGITSFGLPDMRGRIPVHMGTGPGLTPRPIGQRYGLEAHTLSEAEMPLHNHDYNVLGGDTSGSGVAYPGNRALRGEFTNFPVSVASTSPANGAAMDSHAVGQTGAGIEFGIVAPTQTLKYCVRVNGVYPSRN